MIFFQNIRSFLANLGYLELQFFRGLDTFRRPLCHDYYLTTVGYGDLSPQTTSGRIFAIFFTLIAIGIAGYAISTMAAFVIEREHNRVTRLIWERKMKRIADLSD